MPPVWLSSTAENDPFASFFSTMMQPLPGR